VKWVPRQPSKAVTSAQDRSGGKERSSATEPLWRFVRAVTGCGELAASNFNSKPGAQAHEVSPAILEIIVNALEPLYARLQYLQAL
jgi:hypothetical protein